LALVLLLWLAPAIAGAAEPAGSTGWSRFLIEPKTDFRAEGTVPAEFLLAAIPERVGPGGAAQIAVGLLNQPEPASPPYQVAINVLPDPIVVEPLRFELYPVQLGATTLVTLDGIQPAGHLEAAVEFDPSASATVGIDAFGALRSSREIGRATLSAGDPLTILVATAGAGAVTGDLYAAVVLPSGGFFTFGGPAGAYPFNTIGPLASGVTLGNAAITVLAVPALPPGLPIGEYLLLAAIGPPGGDILSDYFALDSAVFGYE
jgi:hypothetical protein